MPPAGTPQTTGRHDVSLCRKRSGCGITLIEIVIASSIALVVIMAVGQIHSTIVQVTREGRVTSEHAVGAALLLSYMAKSLKLAERVFIYTSCTSPTPPLAFPNPGSCVQFLVRHPPSDPNNWANYRLDPINKVVHFYATNNPPCTVSDTFFDLSKLEVNYDLDAGNVIQSNTIQITVTSQDRETLKEQSATGSVAVTAPIALINSQDAGFAPPSACF